MPVTDSIKPSSCYILGVSGGSGSGKTFFASALQAKLGADQCEIISQDNYYIDQSKNFDFDGGSVNFDHPDSIDFQLLASHVQALKQGRDVEIPIYDFKTHSRISETKTICAKKLIVIDGILIFHPVQLRSLFHEMIFFDTEEDLRYSRRLERDIKERGRAAEGVKNQFFKQVKPMHDLYVEPTKYFAHSIAKDDDDFEKMLLLVFNKIC